MKKIIFFLSLLLSLQAFSQEICNDGKDNDGDGLVDCADKNCSASLECQNAISCNDNLIFYQVLQGKQFVRYNVASKHFDVIHNNTVEINAMGYNVNDGYIYGIQREKNTLLRVGADGIFVDLGAVSGLPEPSTNYIVGDFGQDGLLYVSSTSSTDLYAIDVLHVPPFAVHKTMSKPAETSDFSCSAIDGKFYSLINDTGNLQVLDPATGTISDLGALTPPISCVRGYGASFSDKDGMLYFSCNSSGELYEVDPVHMTATLVDDTGVFVLRNDGAACPYGDLTTTPADGVFCCDTDNLIENPSFEDGNAGFTSDYSYSTAVGPTEYSIVNSTHAATICTAWNVEDPTTCVNGSNGNFLVANGLTSQAANSNNVIWEQTIPNMEVDSQYQFCAKFKHLPTCCFDAVPQVSIEITSNGGLSWTPISSSLTDPCAWDELTFNFVSSSPTETIRILIDQTALSDGNDLAIDDIGLFKKEDQNLQITVAHNGGQNSVTASLGNPGTSDDEFVDDECEYFWLVGEVTHLSPLAITNRMMGHANINWKLTTTFPGYNGGSPNGTFEDDKLYLIGLYSYNCNCYASEYIYQLTYDSGNNKMNLTDLTPKQQASIQEEIVEYLEEAITPETDTKFQVKPSRLDLGAARNTHVKDIGRDLHIRPNPASDRINISFQNINEPGTLRLTDISGRLIKQVEKAANTPDLSMELDKLPSGVYILNFEAGETTISKRVVKH